MELVELISDYKCHGGGKCRPSRSDVIEYFSGEERITETTLSLIL